MDALAMLPIVVVSGFLDGIHPCGIAVLLFFIGFLLYARRDRRGILAAGGAYITGVFLAYLAIGIGIVGVFSFFPAHFMAKAGAALLMAIGLLSIYEGLSGRHILKMPKIASPKIEAKLKEATMPAAFAAGILVGLCAFPCAGGIYVGIIGLLALGGGADMLAYLVLYNLMFVMPLILILLLASHKGVLEKIAEMEKKSRAALRLALGGAMLLLGIFIWMNTM